MKYIKFIGISILVLLFTNCELETFPEDSLSQDDFNSKEGIKLLSTGIYANLSAGVDFDLITFNNYSSDNFAKINRSFNREPGAFTTNVINLLENNNNSYRIWLNCYQNIRTSNLVIESNSFTEDTEKNNAVAEMYFMRAYNYHILSTLFTRPFTQKDISNLGLPLRLNSDDNSEATRSTIDELYEQMISDLKIASKYLNALNSDRTRVSKQAAQALLARIYNSMLSPTNPDSAIAENAIRYADSVLTKSGGKVAMITDATNFFGSNTVERNVWPSNTNHYYQSASNASETIWMIKRNLIVNLGSALDSEFNQQSQGQYLPISNDYYDVLNKYPSDLRNNLIDKTYDPATGDILALADATFNAKSINCNKYSFQDGVLNLGSMIVLRATEMRLIQAEVYAKEGNTAKALENINYVRQRAGVEEFTEANWSSNSYGITNLLDLILNERRLEMIGENQRRSDMYRNKKDIIRTYDFDSSSFLEAFPAGGTGTISRWDSNEIIIPIPYSQVLQSPNIQQNPY